MQVRPILRYTVTDMLNYARYACDACDTGNLVIGRRRPPAPLPPTGERCSFALVAAVFFVVILYYISLL